MRTSPGLLAGTYDDETRRRLVELADRIDVPAVRAMGRGARLLVVQVSAGVEHEERRCHEDGDETMVAAAPAQAADAYVKDRDGQSVRVPTSVVVKLRAKHNVKLVAVAAWLPRSRLVDSPGTRKEFHITIVRVHCATFPLVGRICWRTNEKVVLRSIVDYRVNRQGLQQG